jgi:CBS domain-containing protein
METPLKEILNPDKKICAIESDQSLLTAAKMMAEHKVGSLLVNKNGKFQGIITERDFAFKIAANNLNLENTKIEQVMTRDIITINHNATAQEALQVMTQKRVRHLPVYDDDNHFLGLLSIGDLAKWVSCRYVEKHDEVEHLYQYIHQ